MRQGLLILSPLQRQNNLRKHDVIAKDNLRNTHTHKNLMFSQVFQHQDSRVLPYHMEIHILAHLSSSATLVDFWVIRQLEAFSGTLIMR